MSVTAAEELEALQAIYCNPGELEVHQIGCDDTDTIFSIQIKSDEDPTLVAQVTVVLPPDYPERIGQFSFMCDRISRDGGTSLKRDLEEFSRLLLGQPMLMDLILWLQGHIQTYQKDDVKSISGSPADQSDSLQSYICQLDHMRAKNQYIKTIQKWTDELDLTGYLLFYERWIFILLEGFESQIKEYIVRQRTVSVDVDSKGRSCKERMFSVLAQQPITEGRKRLNKFEIRETAVLHELEKLFEDIDLKSTFDQTIQQIVLQR